MYELLKNLLILHRHFKKNILYVKIQKGKKKIEFQKRSNQKLNQYI